MESFLKRAGIFILIGLLIYLGLYYWSEKLIMNNTEFNRIYKIQTLENSTIDFLILGSSRANPLTYGDMKEKMEDMTDSEVINLSFPGGGIVPNLFLYEYFSRDHEANNLIYVFSPFAFHAKAWNESRIGDLDFYRRACFCPDLTQQYFSYYSHGLLTSIGPAIDYLAGFSKINNQQRFQSDRPEGEINFDETFFHTEKKDIERVNYLYSEGLNPELFSRYFDLLAELALEVKTEGKDFIIIRPPQREIFTERLYETIPDLAEYDRKLEVFIQENNIPFYDLRDLSNQEDYFIDPDHLNRSGVEALIEDYLTEIILEYK
ncbi:MAG: hypothetical protein ACQEQG_08935 [Bacillota bacterium]